MLIVALYGMRGVNFFILRKKKKKLVWFIVFYWLIEWSLLFPRFSSVNQHTPLENRVRGKANVKENENEQRNKNEEDIHINWHFIGSICMVCIIPYSIL